MSNPPSSPFSLLYSYILSMTADTVFSLILGPDIHQDLRGEFCLRQYSNPLKYNICRPVYEYCRLGKGEFLYFPLFFKEGEG
jgi:hypothetical protein